MLNKLGQNVLHIAAKIGEHNLVKSLMRSDDTKHLGVGQDVDGNTPLHLAVLNWRYRSIRTLASDVKILQLRNDNGLTARGIAESVLKPNYIFHEVCLIPYIIPFDHTLMIL
jgi:ankyrin repeat protein